LAVAALITTGVVVVTRSRTSHQSSPANTAAAATTEAPATATTEAPTTVCVPGITPDVMADVQVVHIVAKGCAPGVTYLVAECALNGASSSQVTRGGAGPYPGADPLGDCLRQSVIADATGTISTDFKVQRVFSGVDCGVAPGCVVTLSLPDGRGWSSISGVGVYAWESAIAF
jgi:hypothetical protein